MIGELKRQLCTREMKSVKDNLTRNRLQIHTDYRLQTHRSDSMVQTRTQRERHTHGGTHTHRERDTHREGGTHTQRETLTHTHAHTQRERETHRHTRAHTHTHIHIKVLNYLHPSLTPSTLSFLIPHSHFSLRLPPLGFHPPCNYLFILSFSSPSFPIYTSLSLTISSLILYACSSLVSPQLSFSRSTSLFHLPPFSLLHECMALFFDMSTYLSVCICVPHLSTVVECVMFGYARTLCHSSVMSQNKVMTLISAP